MTFAFRLSSASKHCAWIHKYNKMQSAIFPIVLLLTFIFTDVSSIPPNDECCDLANDESGCLDHTSITPGTFDNCVGGIGVDCEDVQHDINFGAIGTISVDLVTPVPVGSTKVRLKTAVGSILHDLCCIQNPNGAFCHSSNYPIDETLNIGGKANNDCACIMEWRKAAWNLLRGRYWEHDFDVAAGSSDLTPDTSGLNRESWLPTGSGTNYLGYKSDWDLQEVVATSQLCAPPGTTLDCPSEDDNCKVPCIWTSCTACASGCSRRNRRRWNDNGRNHATAGDSDYCCSGEFKEVYWHWSGTRYGTCK